MLFVDVVKRCREVYDDCVALNADLFGCSVLDLCADNMSEPLDVLKRAIVASDIETVANPRIKKQISGYRNDS